MGTRAVVRANLKPFSYGKDIFIATHWDGNPDVLGKDLVKAIDKEIDNYKRGYGLRDYPPLLDLGGIIQKAVFKAAADHHIDAVSTIGEEEFNEKYGDWAEYVYRITPDGRVQWTTEKIPEKPGSGWWGGFKEDAEWNDVEGTEKIEEIVQAAQDNNKKKLKELI